MHLHGSNAAVLYLCLVVENLYQACPDSMLKLENRKQNLTHLECITINKIRETLIWCYKLSKDKII